MNEKRDIAVVLNNVSYEDTWDDSFYERRYIVYTLNFQMKTYLYGPYNTSDVIKKAIIHETLGDTAVNRRAITRTYTPKAKTDIILMVSLIQQMMHWSMLVMILDLMKGLNSYEPRR